MVVIRAKGKRKKKKEKKKICLFGWFLNVLVNY